MRPKQIRTVVALFLAGMLALHLFLLWNLRQQVHKGYADFSIFYSAAKIIRDGPRAQLYDEQTQFQVQRQFAPDVPIRHAALPYNHPPFEALLFVPLTGLSYFAAYLAWGAANLLALFAMPILLRPHVALLQRRSALLWCLAALAFFPVFIALLQGQDSIFLLLLFVLVFVSLKNNADFAAGCWLALGLFRFHLVVPLVLLWLLHWKRKALLGFLFIALVLLAVSLFLVGWQTVWHYPGYLLHMETIMGRGSIVPANMPTLHGFLDTLLGPYIGKTASAILLAVASCSLLFCAAAISRDTGDPTRFDLGFALILVVLVLVSYHAYAHDLSLLFLAMLLVANRLSETSNTLAWRRYTWLVPPILLYLSPLYMVLWFRYGQLNWLALALLLWIWALCREISRRAVEHPVSAGT